MSKRIIKQVRKLAELEQCRACGLVLPVEKLEAHRPNHDGLERAIWLCNACHRAIHKELKSGP